MQKIIPHLWFDTQAQEAVGFYSTLFADSGVTNVTTLHNTPSGDADIVTFKLAGQDFMAISAGPVFNFNPSISMFVVFNSTQELQAVWDQLMDGGKALMPLDTYPWSHKYGWVQDRFGLTWQLSMSDQVMQKITPLLMYTQSMAGKAQEAIDLYTSVFPDSRVDTISRYEKGEGDTEGFIKHARFTLCGQQFMAMDSSGPHQFVFNEAISLLVECDSQEEIDEYWSKLSAVPEAEQCGWLRDKFGVSWQISSRKMEEMMTSGDRAAIDRVTQAFLPMKKIDIAALESAYKGE